MANKKKGTRGFTLIEVTVAGFVFAVAALGLTAVMSQSGRMTHTARDEVAARMGARSAFAEMLALPFDQLQARNGSGFNVPGLRPAKDDKDGLPGEVSLEAGPDGTAGIHRVRVRIRWQSATGIRTLESTHLISNVRGALEAAAPTSADGVSTSTYDDSFFALVNSIEEMPK